MGIRPLPESGVLRPPALATNGIPVLADSVGHPRHDVRAGLNQARLSTKCHRPWLMRNRMASRTHLSPLAAPIVADILTDSAGNERPTRSLDSLSR